MIGKKIKYYRLKKGLTTEQLAKAIGCTKAAISLYENMQNVLVGKIVKQRELPILKMAKKLIKNGGFLEK